MTAPSTPRYPAEWAMDAVLADGSTVHLRPIQPTDGAALRHFHERLSAETVYLRFFGPRPTLPDADVERFTHVDYQERVAVVALLHDEIVAVARYDRIGGEQAEIAFVVADGLQGRGIGTLLLEWLAAYARANGITRFIAETLTHNRRMLDVFHAAGAELVDPSCGACIKAGPGVSDSPNQVTVSAINRNFPGRSGPGKVYLASPLVVAASAIAGKIVGPDAV